MPSHTARIEHHALLHPTCWTEVSSIYATLVHINDDMLTLTTRAASICDSSELINGREGKRGTRVFRYRDDDRVIYELCFGQIHLMHIPASSYRLEDAARAHYTNR